MFFARVLGDWELSSSRWAPRQSGDAAAEHQFEDVPYPPWRCGGYGSVAGLEANQGKEHRRDAAAVRRRVGSFVGSFV